MNISRIEKIKLLYLFDQDEEKTNTVLRFRKSLTAYWFELYVKYFFEKIEWYKTTFWSDKTTHKDYWIDIKWIKGNKNNNMLLLIQCKKISNKKIWLSDIASFYWLIVAITYKYPNTKVYYITTSADLSREAYNFAEENWIMIKDFSNIIKMNELYSLEKFREDIIKDNLKLDEIFIYQQLNLLWKLENSYFLSKKQLEKETIELLKIIRYKIAQENQLFLYDVCKNETIKLLAEKRPHNFESLKEALEKSWINYRERKNIERYWEIFIKGLLLIKE